MVASWLGSWLLSAIQMLLLISLFFTIYFPLLDIFVLKSTYMIFICVSNVIKTNVHGGTHTQEHRQIYTHTERKGGREGGR
jgi:hypothetical protein